MGLTVAVTPPSELRAADIALLSTVGHLDAEALAAPSLLPGWSRAHVVAHLTLNAEAFVGVLAGVAAGTPTPMYASGERRNTDIDDLVALSADEPDLLRARLTDAQEALLTAIAAAPDSAAAVAFERTPGSGAFRTVGALGPMRLDEVEVHHADLGAGYGPRDWTASYARGLLDRIATRPGGPDLQARATDQDAGWTLGAGGPVVAGPAWLLAWWLTGRDPDLAAGSGRLDGVLTVDGGDLPQIGAW